MRCNDCANDATIVLNDKGQRVYLCNGCFTMLKAEIERIRLIQGTVEYGKIAFDIFAGK